MLCTFKTEHGDLVIRSDDIRIISDGSDGTTMLRWELCGEERSTYILGTAAENRDRLSQVELDMIAKVETHRYQLQMLLQAQPTPRGRQAK